MTEEVIGTEDYRVGAFTSPTIGKIIDALSKAQGEFEHAKKNVRNEFFKSKYADLASVIDAARKPLSKNGLAVVQITRIDAVGKLILVTTLGHTSGEWMKAEYPIVPVKGDPQGFGSAMAYARRYCFSAITGIAQEDDDGDENNIDATTITTEQAAEIDLLIASTKADRAAFLKYFAVGSVQHLKAADYAAAKGLLAKKSSKAVAHD